MSLSCWTDLLFSLRSRRKRAEDDLDDEYEDRSKSPMYDELSLPFIDASLPPTPRVGRIVNGLDILLGHGVSENSLVGKFEVCNDKVATSKIF